VPIVRGIPRFLPGEVDGWLRKNQDTFSLEWKMFRGGERNWGQDIEYRKQLFLKALGKQAEDLAGKILLDAGCGSAVLAMALAESFRMEVVALDLAFGIEAAYKSNKNPFVHFVQGSVTHLPIRDRAVDFVYCGGVLVALPDAKAGFAALKPPLKPHGRLFVWVYNRLDDPHHAQDRLKLRLYTFIRRITSALPIGAQQALYLTLIPAFVAKRMVRRLIGRTDNMLSWREKMQDLTDMFSPVYQHRFSESEVVDWYRQEGFCNAEVAYTEHQGFGVRGDVGAAHPRSWAAVSGEIGAGGER
jgi:ubiquinone/menaquinone biosynthesis C-methylase UbiE